MQKRWQGRCNKRFGLNPHLLSLFIYSSLWRCSLYKIVFLIIFAACLSSGLRRFGCQRELKILVRGRGRTECRLRQWPCHWLLRLALFLIINLKTFALVILSLICVIFWSPFFRLFYLRTLQKVAWTQNEQKLSRSQFLILFEELL